MNYLVICAWCQKILKEGAIDNGISHGICETCSEKMLKDLEIGESNDLCTMQQRTLLHGSDLVRQDL